MVRMVIVRYRGTPLSHRLPQEVGLGSIAAMFAACLRRLLCGQLTSFVADMGY